MKQFQGIFRLSGWAAVLALFASLTGCGGGGSSGVSDGGVGSGTLGVSLTDAPACGFDAVNLTISKVRVHQSAGALENAGGWSEIVLRPARKINLLDLNNGALEDLGQITLPAGHYTQVRLVLEPNGGAGLANSVVLSNTTGEIALITPSAVQSGIKLIHEFDVAAGRRADLVLDFDACKSIVTLGNGSYLLKPVIKVIPFTLNGIGGFIDDSLRGHNVTISAQIGGQIIRSTVPNPLTGAFLLARLEPGTYDVVITADDHASAVITSVPVAADENIVALSTLINPLSLPASGSQSIGGQVTLAPANTSDPVFVTAKQVVGGVPSVTVKSQSVDIATSYTMILPVAAPLLGQYIVGGTLPIPFTIQPASAGRYTIEASAQGYQTQFLPANISSGGVTGLNFMLTP